MPRKLIEVFLSSTATDLADHRDAIHAELSSTGVFHCVRQEDFGPQDAGAVEFCRQSVQDADIFLGLVGLRRGWEPDGDNSQRSITEMEHDWAKEARRRRFLYVAPDDFKVSGQLRESDAQHARQQMFRQRVTGGGERIVSQKGFETPERLAADVVKHLLCQLVAGNIIAAAPRQSTRSEETADDQKPAIAAAVEKLAEDEDVDLPALARDPQGVDIAELEAKLTARAERHAATGQHENKTSAGYWRHIGALAFLSNTQKALTAYDRAVALDPSNPEGWRFLGELQYRRGDLSDAKKSFIALLDLGKRIADTRAESMACTRLGWICASQGNLGEAETLTADALRLAEGWPEGTARAYCNLGNIHAMRGVLNKAEEMMREALTLYEELGDKVGMATNYGNLGAVHQTRSEFDKAEEMLRKALALNEEAGSKEGMARDYGNLSNVHQRRGELDKAEAMLRRALTLNKELDNKDSMAGVYGNLGVIYEMRGNLNEAEDMQDKALTLNKELDNKDGMARAYGNLGIIHQTRGEFDKAEEMLRQALTLNKELDNKDGMVTAYDILGDIHQTRGELDKAEETHCKALALYEELGDKEGIADVSWKLALIYERHQNKTRLCQHLRRARDLRREMGRAGDVTKAERWLKRAECPDT